MAFTVGRHRVTITETGISRAKNAGTEQIAIGFADKEGNTITAYLACSEKAWPYTEEKLQNCGWDPQANGYRFEDLNFAPSPIEGNEVDITIKEEEYDGKVNLKVAWINAPGAGIERMPDAEAASFAETLRRRLLNGGGAVAVPRGQSRKATQPSYPEEDPNEIPF